jgi:quercetin dioxygenase-like cupin family protein
MNDTLAINGVEVFHHFGHGTYIKETRIPQGVSLQQHVHPHSHQSILVVGEVYVTVGDRVKLHIAPAVINVAAGIRHEVMAVKDSVWMCVHATNDTDPETVDQTILTGG